MARYLEGGRDYGDMLTEEEGSIRSGQTDNREMIAKGDRS